MSEKTRRETALEYKLRKITIVVKDLMARVKALEKSGKGVVVVPREEQ